MQERTVEIKTPDGRMTAYVTHPEGARPYPSVMLLMDAVGLREELCDMARRIASVGYYVVVPNLYYRETASFDFDADRINDPAYAGKVAELWRLRSSLTQSMVASDAEAMLSFLDGEQASLSARVAAIGYSMSGAFVFRLAGVLPDRIAAAASIFGVRLIDASPNSPHLLADRVNGELYFAWAEHDDYASEKERTELVSSLSAIGFDGVVELYPGTRHGFVFPSLRAYQRAGSDRHWEQIFGLLKRNLSAV